MGDSDEPKEVVKSKSKDRKDKDRKEIEKTQKIEKIEKIAGKEKTVPRNAKMTRENDLERDLNQAQHPEPEEIDADIEIKRAATGIEVEKILLTIEGVEIKKRRKKRKKKKRRET